MRTRILLVEDEDPLRALLTKYLDRLEYDVDGAANAEDAWAMFSAAPERYQLLLVDLTLPGMQGDELMRKAIALSPTVNVLISSGYPFEFAGLEARDRARTAFLQKPYLPRQLSERIARMLGPQPSA